MEVFHEPSPSGRRSEAHKGWTIAFIANRKYAVRPIRLNESIASLFYSSPHPALVHSEM
jgi:hypothetical protein